MERVPGERTKIDTWDLQKLPNFPLSLLHSTFFFLSFLSLIFCFTIPLDRHILHSFKRPDEATMKKRPA